MTAYLWAAVGCGVLAVAAYPVLSYLIDKPEGTHRRAPWWRRIRDRRQEERAQDALNLRLIHDIWEGIDRESAGRTSSGMPRTQWPLQPLPAGVEEAADHFHRPLPAEPEEARTSVLDSELVRLGWTEEKWGRSDLWAPSIIGRPEWIGRREPEPEDPLDVATPGQVADAYVGDLCPRAFIPAGGGSGSGLHICTCSRFDGHSEHHMCPECGAAWTLASETPEPLPAPEPEPAPLTDYGEQTGSWEALVDAVMPKDGA